jgi:hypothetical protein
MNGYIAASLDTSGLNVSLIVVIAASILTAIFASITAPLILIHRTERIHREDQLEQYRREDQVALRAQQAASDLMQQQERTAAAAAQLVKQVADQAAEAASKLQAAQQESIARTDEVARLAAISAKTADAKLDQIDLQAKRIHTLVNSDMTAARQSELDQTRAMVVVLTRVIQLANRTPGAQPDPQDVQALESARLRVTDLESILADRMAQMREVEAEQKINPIADPDSKG